MVMVQVFPKDASELLPVYNKTSSQRYSATEHAKDWSEPVDGFGLHRHRVDSFKPTTHWPPEGMRKIQCIQIGFRSGIMSRLILALLSSAAVRRQYIKRKYNTGLEHDL